MLSTPAKAPLNVHLYLTPVCNLPCREFCYYNALPRHADTGQVLTPREAVEAITALCDDYDADFHVEGGEVFLRDDLPEFFRLLPPAYRRQVTLTTNGTLPIHVPFEYLRDVGDLRVSVEGHTDALQRTLRGIPLAPVLKTCTALRDGGVPFTLRLTLFRANHHLLFPMLEFYGRQGFGRFSFFEFQASGRGTGAQHVHGLDETQMESVLRSLASQPLPQGVERFRLSLNPSRVTLVDRYRGVLGARELEVISLAGVPSLTINPNGDLGVSPWNATALGLGDRFASLHEVDLRTEVARQLQTGRLHALCSHCSEVQIRRCQPA